MSFPMKISAILLCLVVLLTGGAHLQTAWAAEAFQSAPNAVHGFKFEGKSYRMLEASLELCPSFLRKKSRENILNRIAKKEVSTVTEGIMLDAIKEETPKIFLGQTMKKLDEL